MSWMQKLYDTYEECSKIPDFQVGENSLLPIYHTSQQAHIEATLNQQAQLVSAKVLTKENSILPATESSAGRAGKKDAPHALADKIQYCAGDYSDYGGRKKSYFDSYIKQLGDWCESPFSHPKVKIIYEYLKKKRLVADLVRKGVLHVDDENNQRLTDDWKDEESDPPEIFRQLQREQKSKKYDQGNALVRWRVEVPGNLQSASWEDATLFKSWRNYCLNQDSQQNLCHISGEMVPVASNHPRGIRKNGDWAKLISVPTDSSFYTYKGRFI
ncbi:MAG: type I-C CRISPR-associated protein Cas8c/Csd1, partial [Nitrospinales bacterium]